MTTPAENINTGGYVDGQTITIYRNPATPPNYGAISQRLWWAETRNRPQSVSTAKVPVGGIRAETGWTHVGSRWKSQVPLTLRELRASGGVSEVLYVNNQRFNASLPATASFNQGLFERAVNGALEKLKGQSVNVALAFVERKKTGELFSRAAQAIARSLQKLQELKKGKVWSQVLKTVPGVGQYPGEYLAMCYGWDPLVRDVTGSMQELAGLEDRVQHPYWIEVTGTGKESDSEVVQFPFCWVVTAGPRYLWGTKSTEEKARAVFRYRMDLPVLQKASELGLTNLPSLAWESLPYSHVLDWALPVGNWLNLLDADFGWLYLNGSVSRILRCRYSGSYFKGMESNYSIITGRADNCQWNAFRFQRYVYHDPPQAYYPRIRNPFAGSSTPTRIAQSLAMLTQAIQHKPPGYFNPGSGYTE